MIYDVAIIGAGVIGGMLARQLMQFDLSCCLLEKENDVAMGASKANSGIVHGGYDPEPGTLKAKLNAEGVEKLFVVAGELHAPIRRNGSFVCAFGTPEEEGTLRTLYERGLANGIPGLSLISGDEARKIEPALSPEVSLVLNVTNAGIVCPYELTIAAIGNAMDNGAHLKCNFAVTAICRDNDLFTVTAENGEQVTARYLVNCAGAYSDEIAALAGDRDFAIIPRAGEYMLLDKTEGTRVSRTIFQVPSAEGKGILVAPTMHGNLLTGPTAVKVEDPTVIGTTSAGLEAVNRLAAKSVPDINFRNVITSFSGIRASEKSGDFIIREAGVPHMVHVAAIDSPGLTSAVAIADYTINILQDLGLSNEKNPDFCGVREDPHAFREMSDEEKDAFIKQNPAFGKIVCRCETVSEGEIRRAIRQNPPATDIDGVKRRTRSGMGRCQGGFCMPYVMRLLAEEQGVEMEKITKNGKGSEQLVGRM